METIFDFILQELYMEEKKQRTILKIKKYLKDPFGGRAVKRAKKGLETADRRFHKSFGKSIDAALSGDAKAKARAVDSIDRPRKVYMKAVTRSRKRKLIAAGAAAGTVGTGMGAKTYSDQRKRLKSYSTTGGKK